MLNSSLKSGVIDSLFSKIKFDQLPSGIEDGGVALTLPKFYVERAVHVLDVLAMPHHRKIAVFAFYYKRFHI